MKQYFPNDQHITMQDYARVKDPFKFQDLPLDINVTVNKKINEQ